VICVHKVIDRFHFICSQSVRSFCVLCFDGHLEVNMFAGFVTDMVPIMIFHQLQYPTPCRSSTFTHAHEVYIYILVEPTVYSEPCIALHNDIESV